MANILRGYLDDTQLILKSKKGADRVRILTINTLELFHLKILKMKQL